MHGSSGYNVGIDRYLCIEQRQDKPVKLSNLKN